jgi:membrane-bound inhibitor of C-type lysozyme
VKSEQGRDGNVTIRKLAVAAAAATLAGCSSWWPFGSSPSPDRPWYPADASVYKCEANKTLVVRYLEGGKAAMVMFPDREFRLDQVRSASGVAYSNGRTDLRTKGDEVQLEEGGNAQYANCKRVQQ